MHLIILFDVFIATAVATVVGDAIEAIIYNVRSKT